jgi:hypothetical protein
MSVPSTPRLAVFGALLAACFVAGVAVGVIGDRLAAKASPQVATRIKLSGDMSGVLDRLELTREQRAQAESILSHRAPRSESLMMEMADRLRAVSDSVDAELRQILTAPQRSRLDSLRANGPQFMLKRKVVTPGGTTVDSVVMPRRDSAARPR